MAPIPNLNWRYVYILAIGLRFVFALSNSYIHPDEHFQNFEILANKIFNFTTTIPWEFSTKLPARSLGPLYLVYGPLLYGIKFFKLDFTPLQIWYLIRLQNVIIGWLITDICIYRLLPSKPERIKGIFFTSTSYITLVYQSHCFSNAIETQLVLLSLLIIDDLRFIQESKEPEIRQQRKYKQLWWLGVIVSIGIFNRITFPAFILLPSWFVITYLWSNKSGLMFCILGFITPTILFILIDSLEFGISLNQILANPFEFRNYVITPLNNLIYNSSYENLSTHGIHPLYTHLLINLPQILGPSGLILLFYSFSNRYWKTLPFLSAFSGILILSLVPHQELRFLLPMLPLICCCFDLNSFSKPTPRKGERVKSSSFVTFLINLWYIFNLLAAILMGIYHQGGVVPALDYFHQSIFKASKTKTIQIWWRTYSPPSWILGDKSSSLQILTLNDININYSLDFNKNYLIDTMGTDFDKVIGLINTLKQTTDNQIIYLITPIASFNINFKNQSEIFKQIWDYSYHYDLDHLDLNNMESIKPGLGIYELL